ncbi:hypothetical protein O7632_14230 [Solwaraspora sp. WMMD406]|uniref:hypothetical protein n=1 Tax=Solwaraspora sp. WMMD406 TaxID=3016095 RepID=UPI00241648EB|nr:hypothetical protein [Solwaraspora sp. WMMD406]MDG4765244.1 hypothetical protein [Solwaraspora sp. WMMD406]
MRSEHDPEAALRDMAEHAERTGRISVAADIRRRGDTIRRRRQLATAAFGVLLIGAVGAGAAAVQIDRAAPPLPIGPAGPTPTPIVSPDASQDASPSPSVGTPSVADPIGAPPVPGDPLLVGDRQIAIVRTEAFESAVSLLDEGRLAEVDGDEGRRLFVIEPQGEGTYQIRTAEPDADGADTCWQVGSSGRDSLVVGAAVCSPDEPRQWFDIAVVREQGDDAYAISNSGAYLRHSRTSGLIFEELGDATSTAVFRFVDNGPAPG